MNKEYPTIVVLSNDINPDGTLREDVRRRTDGGIILYNAGLTDKLTMSGKCTTLKEGKMEADITQAEAMIRHALKYGVTRENLIREDKSITTVGQAYCVKRGLAVPNNWEKLGVLTSDFHIERTRSIFDFIFGPDFKIDYISVPSEYHGDQEMIDAETKRLELFRNFWKGVRRGDDEAIAEKMHTEFPFYKGKTWEEL